MINEMKVKKKTTEELDVSNEHFSCSLTKIKQTDEEENESIEFDKVVLKKNNRTIFSSKSQEESKEFINFCISMALELTKELVEQNKKDAKAFVEKPKKNNKNKEEELGTYKGNKTKVELSDGTIVEASEAARMARSNFNPVSKMILRDDEGNPYGDITEMDNNQVMSQINNMQDMAGIENSQMPEELVNKIAQKHGNSPLVSAFLDERPS